MAHQLPVLPYDMDALEPHVSATTLEYHYGKHHKAYVDKLNAAIAGTDYADMDLEAIISASQAAGDTAVFNNAAQAWNHTFLWNSMSPEGGGNPTAPLAMAIDDSFGGIDAFRQQFKTAALGQFGSGWTWLVARDSSLEIVSTGNADTPLTGDMVPLLTLDVWEHAYYLDYQNQRDRYIDAFLDTLINWEFATRNLATVRAAA